ncbi:MAG: N-formylglutamate amidohydrolase [Acidimicrobiales bacterium]
MKDRTDPSSFFPAFVLKEPDPSLETPVVIDSPHSERIYPGDFNFVAPKELLEQRGRTVGVNDYFSGGDLIVQHGKPETGRHAIMIEINRGNYLQEVAVEKSEGFEEVQNDLKALIFKLSTEFEET